jgi:DNA-binding MarR family transcriptional regulator
MQQNHFDEVLVAIRRIIRAVDLQSRRLVQSHGLTGPQALVLKEAGRGRPLTAGELASNVSLSQGTLTDIVKRLEGRGLLVRERSSDDKRRIIITLTDQGRAIIARSLPLLQERFEARFRELRDWEQNQLLYSVQRLAALMDADTIDASPVLTSGSLRASAEAVEQVVIDEDNSD